MIAMVPEQAHTEMLNVIRHALHLIAPLLFCTTLWSTTYAVQAATGAPPLGALANATYAGLVEQPVTLRDGVWEGEPYVPGGASRPRVMLVPGFRITGDLDDNGDPETVVLLAVSSGGSGNFSHLAVAGWDEAGRARVLAVAPLGDRVQVRYARIEGGELRIDTVEAGEGDGACCPGEKRMRHWRLVDDTLEEGEAITTGRLGPDDLGGGITWSLTHLDRDTRVPVSGAPTLNYAEGKLAGFAGCNRYFGSVEAGEGPGEVKIGPLGTTRKACAPAAMELESDFLRRLGAVEKFMFRTGRLVLSYRDGEGSGGLLFRAGE